MTRRKHLELVLQGALLGSVVGVICGAASAVFLWLLDRATTVRTHHEFIIYALPIAGLVIGSVYSQGPEIPLRMAPLALIGTVLTHLFGGSAGREGTAAQMGASLSDWLCHRWDVSPQMRQQWLYAGVCQS